MNERTRRARTVQEAIREVLLRDWDPIGIADDPHAQGEYNSYVGGVYRLLAAGASQAEIEEHLRRVAKEEMGLHGVDCSAAARKLLAVNIRL